MKEDNDIPISLLRQIHLRTLLFMEMISYTCNSLTPPILIIIPLYLLVVIIGYLGGSDSILSRSFKNNTIPLVSSKYPVYLTPHRYAFAIWGLIYTVQLSWILYFVVTIFCLKKKYLNIIGAIPLYLFIMSCIFNLSWVFLWLKERIISSLVAILLLTFSLYSSYTYSASCIDGKHWNNNENKNEHIPSTVKIVLRSIFLNGIAMYATWCLIATILNIQIVLTYSHNYTENKSTFLCLSLLIGAIFTLFTTDLSARADANRYIISPYFVFLYALIGIIYKHKSDITHKDIGIYVIVVCLCSFLTLVMKMVYAFYPISMERHQFLSLSDNNIQEKAIID